MNFRAKRCEKDAATVNLPNDSCLCANPTKQFLEANMAMEGHNEPPISPSSPSYAHERGQWGMKQTGAAVVVGVGGGNLTSCSIFL